MDSIAGDYRTEVAKALENGITEDALAKIRKQTEAIVCDIEDDIACSLQSNLAERLAGHVHECFSKAFEAMLRGNEDEFRRWIHADEFGYTGRDREHSVIHGKLFEAGPLELRKIICDAYPDTLKSERVFDLEAQVESLVMKIVKLEDRNDNLIQRMNAYARAS